MALEILKRATIAVYLRLLIKRQDAMTAQMTRVADTLDLLLKFQCLQANLPLSALRDAAELQTMEDEVHATGPQVGPMAAPRPAAGAASARPAYDLLQQTPEDLARLERTAEHLVQRLGRGNIPDTLDLYAEARKLEPDNPDELP